ncbi:Adenine-specific DNA methyltransferase [Leucobacter sp. 7(1)]|nr:Adenine-specific DNA methyltransferase [Leucobacter sp. 7(1)]
MSDKRLLGLGSAVREIAAENSFCFLWVTAATVPLGLEVLKAWGYDYKNFYFWAKGRFTLGNTFRNAGELMLLGMRGKGTRVAFKSQPNWGFHALQSHSTKPQELHLMVERLVGANEDTKMLELFARRPAPSRLNWDIWGNEIPSSEPSLISLVKWGYPVPGDHPAGAGLVSGDETSTTESKR